MKKIRCYEGCKIQLSVEREFEKDLSAMGRRMVFEFLDKRGCSGSVSERYDLYKAVGEAVQKELGRFVMLKELK